MTTTVSKHQYELRMQENYDVFLTLTNACLSLLQVSITTAPKVNPIFSCNSSFNLSKLNKNVSNPNIPSIDMDVEQPPFLPLLCIGKSAPNDKFPGYTAIVLPFDDGITEEE